MEYLQNQFELMFFKQEEALQAKKTYEHMIERMKVEFLSLKTTECAHLNQYINLFLRVMGSPIKSN